MPPEHLALPYGTRERIGGLDALAEGVEDAIALAFFGVPQGGHLTAVGAAQVGQQGHDSLGRLLGHMQGGAHQQLGEGGQAQGRH